MARKVSKEESMRNASFYRMVKNGGPKASIASDILEKDLKATEVKPYIKKRFDEDEELRNCSFQEFYENVMDWIIRIELGLENL